MIRMYFFYFVIITSLSPYIQNEFKLYARWSCKSVETNQIHIESDTNVTNFHTFFSTDTNSNILDTNVN